MRNRRAFRVEEGKKETLALPASLFRVAGKNIWVIVDTKKRSMISADYRLGNRMRMKILVVSFENVLRQHNYLLRSNHSKEAESVLI